MVQAESRILTNSARNQALDFNPVCRRARGQRQHWPLLGENLTLSVGYTCLYINQVIRPGDEIDPVVNLQNFKRPIVSFRGTDF